MMLAVTFESDQPDERRAGNDKPARPAAPAMPREHGAWGILLVPFISAVAVAGVFNLPVVLLLGSILSFYIARTSWLKSDMRWTIRLLAVSGLLAVPLLAVWRLWWLPVFAVVALPLAARKTGHGLAMQLASIAGLTLTAPAAWYAATGHLDGRAAMLWVLNALYFVGGVFHVKMHLAAAINRVPLDAMRDRWRTGSRNLVYHVGAMAVVAGLSACGWVPAAVLAGFGLALGRAMVATMMLSPKLRIKRLGWSEVVFSLVFMVLVVVALRMESLPT
jgi:hypothetical protein